MSTNDERWSNWMVNERHVSRIIKHYEGLMMNIRVGYFAIGAGAGFVTCALLFGVH